ncbi:MAG: O-antigen ligase family protein [Verrucomicrobiota bacterium]|jgi:hypothetical protein
MELKYLIFWAVFLGGIPIGIILCTVFRSAIHWTAVLLLWATAVPESAGINFFSRELYRTSTRGVEVSLVDLCALVMCAAIFMQPARFKIRWIPPLTVPYAVYILIALASWSLVGPAFGVPDGMGAPPYDRFEVGLYPLFEISKVIRGCFVYWVMVNYLQEKGAVRALVVGFAVTAFYMALVSLTDRYLFGVHRVQATLGHANSLATYMAMTGTVMFAFALGNPRWLISGLFTLLTGLAGGSVILTISRGGLMALAVGLYAVWSALYRRFFNIKNTVIVVFSLGAGLVVLWMAADTLRTRFVDEQDAGADLEYRRLYNEEGRLMARDHLLGVGMGNFSAWSWNRYAELVDPELPPGTPAHNIWYLTAGELGIPGLLALIWIWARFYAMTLPVLWGKGVDLLTVLAVAAVASTLVCHLQSLLQLGYRQTPMYFMIRILMAAAVAAYLDRREEA